LVVLYRAFVLAHQFFLVVENLFGDGVARPCLLVALQIHLGLGEKIFVPLERALRLHEHGAVGARVYVNQRVARRDALAFGKVHAEDYSRDLRGDRSRVHRSDCADRVQINADIAFLRRGGGDGDAGGANLRGRGFFGVFVVAIDQEERNP
jgi:hypothetical protein